MKLINELKRIFAKNTTNEEKDELIVEYEKEIARLKEAVNDNSKLKTENANLKKEVSSLSKKINDLKSTIVQLQSENTNKNAGMFTYYSKTEYLPKQEPIRSAKPKKNRNKNKKYYRMNDDKKRTKISNNNSMFIKSEDIPKPGSHDKVEFKSVKVKSKNNEERKVST